MPTPGEVKRGLLASDKAKTEGRDEIVRSFPDHFLPDADRRPQAQHLVCRDVLLLSRTEVVHDLKIGFVRRKPPSVIFPTCPDSHRNSKHDCLGAVTHSVCRRDPSEDLQTQKLLPLNRFSGVSHGNRQAQVTAPPQPGVLGPEATSLPGSLPPWPHSSPTALEPGSPTPETAGVKQTGSQGQLTTAWPGAHSALVN